MKASLLLLLLLPGSGAAPGLSLDGYVEVERVPAEGGLLSGGQAFLRTNRGCLPARIEGEQIEVELCSREGIRCSWTAGIGAEWQPYGDTRCTLPDGSGWGSLAGGSHHGFPELVELSRTRATWRSLVTIAASFEHHRRELHPCTPESLAAPGVSGQPQIQDGQRACDTSAGLILRVVPAQAAEGIGFAVSRGPQPVDCRLPCPENPQLAAVQEANIRLAGWVFAPVDGELVQLFASEAECSAAKGPAWGRMPKEDCVPPP